MTVEARSVGCVLRPLTRPRVLAPVALCTALLAGCGPRAHIPPRPVSGIQLSGALTPDDRAAKLARALAPLLYLTRDEWFPLERAVAVVHPQERIIAYHLLWRDDVHGSWIPFTVPTDQEIVWVGYDSTYAPTELWTYWHGTILHTNWRDKGQPTIDVQWGKHGSLPHGIIESDLPGTKTLNGFYLTAWLALPDIWLSRLTRKGPLCFCHGYARYRDYSRPLFLSDRLDAVVMLQDPTRVLQEVFGKKFSRKRAWPLDTARKDERATMSDER
jgi:hypothetical protein